MGREMGSSPGQRSRVISLDTHVLLWMVDGDAPLGVTTRVAIDEAPEVFSTISAWEIAMLISRSKLALAMTPEALFHHLGGVARVRVLAVGTRIALDAGRMPRFVHGDPGDRIIMASARALDCPLVTADRTILAHAAAGHLRAIDARA